MHGAKLLQSAVEFDILRCDCLDLPRFSAAPTARLGHFLFEGERTVPTQC